MGLKDRQNKRSGEREIQRRLERLFVLIVCEGMKTEPNYFKSFVRSNIKVDIVPAAGNTLGVVEKAIEVRDRETYDQVWCVFDRDSFPPSNFDNAIHKARANNIKVAYSNEAFELWYILHFAYHQSSTSRDEYEEILSQHLQKPYKKNDLKMKDQLGDKVYTAILNAKKLRRTYTHHVPNRDNPYTTVDELVSLLLENTAP